MKMMLVVNPTAGAFKVSKKWEEVKKLLEREKITYDYRLTSKPKEATPLTREALREGYEHIVVVGGDGTVHEVVNGFFDSKGLISKRACLSLIPIGTANDFVVNASLVKDYREAISKLKSDEIKKIDIVRVQMREDTRYSTSISGIGFDSEVSKESFSSPKFLGKTLSYIYSVFKALIRLKSYRFEINLDGERFSERAIFVDVCNASYYGGGMMMAPDARIDSGFFDLVIAGEFSRFETIRTLPKVYSGTHIQSPKVKVMRGRRVEISTEKVLPIHAEGELIGETPATFELLSKVLRIRG
ncbi:MAG: diacylglycerol/lipid kinase family protein [Candidatus Methanofastidiosia archaeon]